MSKTPPSRRGITFEVGAALEARDSLRNWYAANIEKIDYDDEKILIHYRQWSHRYDEWFDWASPYLRPMERVQLRREGRQEDGFIPGFQINDKVLASWSDCRFYPAKVLSVNKDGSYTVKFYDGVIQRVKGIHVKPFIREKRKKLTDKNGERAHVKTKKIEENEESGGPEVSLNTLSSTNGVPNEDEPGLSGLNEDKTEQTQSRVQDCDVKHQNGHHQDPEIISVKEENDILEQIEQHNYSKSFLKKYPEAEETEVENLVEYKSAIDFQEKTLKRNENEEAEVQVKQNKEDIKRDASLPHARKPQRQQIRRKKKASVGRKRSKKNRIDDKSSNNECISSISSHKALQPIVSDLLQPSTTIPSSQSQANIFKSAVRKQSHQNPNRFSREPLYRVIRNQPPPLLSINLDHNLYKCSSAGCGKSFRKAKLLEYHRKYYHRDHSEEASRMKTISKPMTFNHQEGFKRKRIKPSCVTGLQGHVRCFSSERSRENVLDVQKNVRKEKERRLLYMEALNERDLPEKKQSENVMHIKLKKKMRTTTSDEESASDWSSDSSEWSEDEPGMDVDVMSSSVSASSVASTTGSPETVRCVCEVEEENDFMLQCEDCLYWQHGTCMGLLEENVPEHYVCFICRESSGGMKLQSRGLQYWYDGDWLHSGCMYGLSFLENYSQQNSMKIAATHQLLGDVQHVGEVINGLQLKISVLQSQTHPDLRFWSQPWKPSERARKTNTALSEYQPGSTPFPDERSNKETFISAFQDYISSEHCYQKPQTLHQAQKTRANSVLHYSERPSFLKVSSNGKGIKDECDVSDGSKEQQWRINLLEHIETVQDQVSHRMDFIEKELDVLENWLDCTGELEPPEPLDRLPELKQSIKQLLVELGKIQQIALSCAT